MTKFTRNILPSIQTNAHVVHTDLVSQHVSSIKAFRSVWPLRIIIFAWQLWQHNIMLMNSPVIIISNF